MTQSKKSRAPRLGRGLSSLLTGPVQVGDVQPQPTAPVTAGNVEKMSREAGADVGAEDAVGPRTITYVRIDHIEPNPHQPRQDFDEPALQRLADSIGSAGLMQPIILRPPRTSNGAIPGPSVSCPYQLVAGERRWRAAKLAGLDQVPAIVRELDDHHVAEWALIENLQREDLNPIERAHAFQYLLDEFGLSHEQVAQRVGVERPTISNSLRLLNLHVDLQMLVRQGQLSGGQARALAGLADVDQQLRLAKRAIGSAWSVRRLEAEVRSLQSSKSDNPSVRKVTRAHHLADLEQRITQQLGAKVRIRSGRRKGTGTLAIDFYSLDQFDALLAKLGVEAE